MIGGAITQENSALYLLLVRSIPKRQVKNRNSLQALGFARSNWVLGHLSLEYKLPSREWEVLKIC